MAIKHDSQGFLTGDPIDIGRALAVWDDIHEDVRAIRRALTEGSPAMPRTIRATPSAQPANQVPALLRKAVIPQVSGTGGNSVRRSSQSGIAAVSISGQMKQRTTVSPAMRDSRGRFVAAGDRRKPDDPEEKGAGDVGALRSLADRIVGAAKESGAGIEEADPAVKAFNEVARPLARGYQMLAGDGEKKKEKKKDEDDERKESWLRRIYTSLTGFRKEESTFNKVANKTLKSIDGKPVATAEGGNGLLGSVGNLLSNIPVVGSLLSGGAGMLSGAMGMGKKGLLGLGKGALRRVPLLGSLLAAGGAASDIFDTENNDGLTRREKDRHDGKAVGGAAGSIGGMFAGAKLGAMVGALGGPIGTAIGGVVGGAAGMFFGDKAGQILGERVGGWVNDLRDADIPGKIAVAWEDTTSAIMSGWEATTKFLQDGWNSATDVLKKGWDSAKDAVDGAKKWVSDKASAANDFIKDKTGADIKAGVMTTKDKAVEVGGQAVDTVKAGADWAAKNTTAGKGVVKAWEGAKAAGNWVLGQTSKLFESGKGGAGTVSSGKGDFGGASYGTYQLSSTQGTLQKFLKSSKYGDQFAGLQPGTPEFNAKWKEIAKADPEFGNAQHDFIKASHYDPALAGLKTAGIDLSERGAAVQDALWSTSVQFGAGSAKSGKGAVGMFQKALAGRDISTMSDQDIVAAIQDYKIANNDTLFAKSSETVRNGTARRATEEKNSLLALAGSQTNSVGAPVVASTNMPPISVAPAVPALAETQPVTVPMGSRDSGKPVVVSVASPDVGQDMRERGIAHVATGGLSA